MGTRADFYVRNENSDPKMKWIGSIAWDGYPTGINNSVLEAATEEVYVSELKDFFSERDDVTIPEHGWPWPWDDSSTTDYAYIFENGKVMCSNFGYPLFDPLEDQDDSEDEDDDKQELSGYFPDMKDVKNINWGKGSGLIIIN